MNKSEAIFSKNILHDSSPNMSKALVRYEYVILSKFNHFLISMQYSSIDFISSHKVLVSSETYIEKHCRSILRRIIGAFSDFIHFAASQPNACEDFSFWGVWKAYFVRICVRNSRKYCKFLTVNPILNKNQPNEEY